MTKTFIGTSSVVGAHYNPRFGRPTFEDISPAAARLPIDCTEARNSDLRDKMLATLVAVCAGEATRAPHESNVYARRSPHLPSQVTVTLSPRSRFDGRILEDLLRLKELKAGWDGRTAEPPSAVAINGASRVLQKSRAAQIKITSIVPSIEGGAGVTFRNGNRWASIEIANDGSWVALVRNDGQTPYAWEGNNGEGLGRAVDSIGGFFANGTAGPTGTIAGQ